MALEKGGFEVERLLDVDDLVEKEILQNIAESCGATAASLIRLDRSGRNRRDNEGLLFEQRAKWISPTAKPADDGWLVRRDEFFGRHKAWGLTGLAFLRGRF